MQTNIRSATAALRRQLQERPGMLCRRGLRRQALVLRGPAPAAPQPQRPSPPGHEQFDLAFGVLDKDADGKLSREEALQLLTYVNAISRRTPQAAQQPLSWDQYLAVSAASAQRLDGVLPALGRFVRGRLSGAHARAPPASDVFWSAAGALVAMLALGVLALHAAKLPVVGTYHQHGLPLVLGSFGTLTLLLIGRPENEAIRPWPLIAGHLSSTAIAIATITVMGAGLWARAVAFAATLAFMMMTDCVHPPGGALVVMSMDSAAIQSMHWAFLLWPSLLVSLAVLLPLSYATTWLKRHARFGWPQFSAPPPPCSKEQQQQRGRPQGSEF